MKHDGFDSKILPHGAGDSSSCSAKSVSETNRKTAIFDMKLETDWVQETTRRAAMFPFHPPRPLSPLDATFSCYAPNPAVTTNSVEIKGLLGERRNKCPGHSEPDREKDKPGGKNCSWATNSLVSRAAAQPEFHSNNPERPSKVM